MKGPWRGIFSIAVTPFDEKGDLLFEDLARQADWIVRAGGHGIVWPVMASQYESLGFEERVRGNRIVVEAVAGRIPVVIGVSSNSTAESVRLAEEARKAGADGVIAMLPYWVKMTNRELIVDYYQRVAKAAGLPVCIQNAGAPMGSALPGEFVVQLCREIEWVEYLKEEKPPQGHSCSEVLALAGPEVKGVFGGAGCLWLIAEMERGLHGNMPASHITDIDALIWDLFQAGKKAEARELHNKKLVLENALRGMGQGAHKEVLVRRGVISTTHSRNLGPAKLDKYDLAELDYCMRLLEPYFKV